MDSIALQPGVCGSCEFMDEWQENQAPLGSGMNWPESFQDCKNNECMSDESEEAENWGMDDKHPCPYWKAMKTVVCDKHGVEYVERYGCIECENDYYENLFGVG